MKTIIAISTLIVMFMYTPLFALQALDDHEMKQAIGQGGILLSVVDLKLEFHADSYKLINPDNEAGYIDFKDIKGHYFLNVGKSDPDGFGYALDDEWVGLPACLDIGTVFDAEGNNGRVMAIFTSGDWFQDLSFEIDQIDWAGTDVGKLEVKQFEMPFFQFMAGSPAGPSNSTGVEFQFAGQIKFNEIEYTYNDLKEKLKFEETMAAESFNGDPLPSYVAGPNPTTPEDIDTDSWEAQGVMKIGDISTNNPATFDVGTVDTGTEKRVAGIMNLPMNGSLRIKKVEMGGQNFGPVAIDGIRVSKMVVEFPGRGLGKN